MNQADSELYKWISGTFAWDGDFVNHETVRAPDGGEAFVTGSTVPSGEYWLVFAAQGWIDDEPNPFGVSDVFDAQLMMYWADLGGSEVEIALTPVREISFNEGSGFRRLPLERTVVFPSGSSLRLRVTNPAFIDGDTRVNISYAYFKYEVGQNRQLTGFA